MDSKKILMYSDSNHENKDIKIPNGIIEIDDGAFQNDEMVEILSIPDTVERLGNSAFEGCSSLRKIYIGNGLKSGGSKVFLNCRNITEVYVETTDVLFSYYPDNFGSPLQYGAKLYEGRVICTELRIPDNIKSEYVINTFLGCSSINKIRIGRNNPIKGRILTYIQAIKDNKKLAEYTIDTENIKVDGWEIKEVDSIM